MYLAVGISAWARRFIRRAGQPTHAPPSAPSLPSSPGRAGLPGPMLPMTPRYIVQIKMPWSGLRRHRLPRATRPTICDKVPGSTPFGLLGLQWGDGYPVVQKQKDPSSVAFVVHLVPATVPSARSRGQGDRQGEEGGGHYLIHDPNALDASSWAATPQCHHVPFWWMGATVISQQRTAGNVHGCHSCSRRWPRWQSPSSNQPVLAALAGDKYLAVNLHRKVPAHGTESEQGS